MRSRKKPILKIFSAIVLLTSAWTAYDLYAPRTAHLRQFDADEVARLETAMWRSYYEKRRLSLFSELAELLRSQYNMPFLRSHRVAYSAANAAVVFQRGKQRSDYERALPELVKFYQSIRQISDVPFDVNKAAQLELEWWIIHRQREQHQPEDLQRALAELQAEIYGLPVERFMDHGRMRAQAMTIRDTKAEQGRVTEADWTEIDRLLHESWRSLLKVVNSDGVAKQATKGNPAACKATRLCEYQSVLSAVAVRCPSFVLPIRYRGRYRLVLTERRRKHSAA